MKLLFNKLLKYKLSILFIIIFTYLSTIFELFLPITLASIFNNLQVTNYLEYMLKMMIVSIIIIIISNFISSLLINRVAIKVSNDLKIELFNKTINSTNKNNLNDATLFNRISNDTITIESFINNLLSTIFKAVFLFINCLTVLNALNKEYFIILFITLSLLILFIIITIIKLFPLSKRIQTISDNSLSILKEKITNFKLIKVGNKFKEEDQRYEQENDNYLNESKKLIKTTSLVMPTFSLIIDSAIISIFFISINLVKTNLVDVGSIVLVIQYILQILLSIVMISLLIILLPQTKISLNRIKEVLNLSCFDDKETSNLIINTIEFKNVSFTYDNNLIFNNLNLFINQSIGILGKTSSGKSSLIKLLLKEEKITNGEILINGINMENIHRNDLLSNISYVSKDDKLLSGSILDNLKFTNSSISDEEISKVIYCSNLENFIKESPLHLNHLIEENGLNLSGGQRQRISLARALSSNKKIIILDDAFSSLDIISEKEILKRLKEYYKDTIFIYLSSKISSLDNAQTIYILNDKNIQEKGTKEELLDNSEFYKQLNKLQKEDLDYDK